MRYLFLFVVAVVVVGCGKQGMLPIPPTAPTMVDDGVAYWQAYWQAPAPIVPNGSGCTDLNNEECLKVLTKQPAVPEAITCEGCGSGDNLPLTVNKESCTTTYKGKWSDDTKTCYLVEQLGAVGAMMEQIAPEKPDKADGKLIFSNPSANMGSGPDEQASESLDRDGYDCTMSRTPKTITIICTLKEPK